ncbi:hypothetical protein CEXT_199581 [Caerostris extrusa]|uniref:Uncharacterized protein n=1 Tax=Caerostris extrusa TaxID=172846 RepID=A0AAV4MVI3_CAEEX|nr:hypothetical protein CEXT_199581 [Caerostris extrusa]
MIKEAAWGDVPFCRKGRRTTQYDFLTECVFFQDPFAAFSFELIYQSQVLPSNNLPIGRHEGISSNSNSNLIHQLMLSPPPFSTLKL